MGEADHRSLTDAVRAVLDRSLAIGDRVIVAVSGGSDSVALLHLCRAARPDLSLLLAHVRHGLRDDTDDAAAAEANARLLAVPAILVAVHVSGGAGPEDAARQARYDALIGVARQRHASVVLVGHTADDQAETLLMRLARGTGPDGLAGMREVSRRDDITLLRPLLGLRRADVRAVAASLPTVEDPSNTDPAQRRSRARHEALPALGRLRGDEGDPVPALVRLAALAQQQQDALDLVDGLVPPRRFGMAVIVSPHREAALAGDLFTARLLRQGWRLLPVKVSPPSAATVRAILGLPDPGSVDVPGGVHVSRTGQDLVLEHRAHPRLPVIPLLVGRPVEIPGHARTITLSVRSIDQPTAPGGLSRDIAMPLEGPDGLVVRGRAADGDRAARAVLQRFPAPLRRHVPLVCAADGSVLMADDTILRPAEAGEPSLRVVIHDQTEGAAATPIR